MSALGWAVVAVAVTAGCLALLALLQVLVALLVWVGRGLHWSLTVYRRPLADGHEVTAQRTPSPPPGDLEVATALSQRRRPAPSTWRGLPLADSLAAAVWGAAVYGLVGFLVLAPAASWMGRGVVGFVVGALGVGLVSPPGPSEQSRHSRSRRGVRAGLTGGATGGVLPVLADAGGMVRLLEPLGPAVWMVFLVTCVAAGAALGTVLAVRGVIAPLRLAREWSESRDGSGNRVRTASSIAACSLWLGAGFAILAMTVSTGILWIHPGLVSQRGPATAAAARVPDVVSTPASDEPASALPATDSASGDSALELPAADRAAGSTPRSETGPIPDEPAPADRLSQLLGRPVSPTARNEHGWTDLHTTAVLDLPELARQLLVAGADVDARSHFHGMDPAVAAELPGRYPPDLQATSLLDKIAPSDLTPLHLATSGDVVAALLAGGADIHARDSVGNTPLHIAAYHNASEATVALLQHGADIHAGRGDDSGRPTTPLHNAAHLLNLEVVRVLLDHGAEVDRASAYGTPLHEAVRERSAEALPVVTALLERGANVDARGYNGRAPLHLAAYSDGATVPLVSMLLERGAAVDAKDDDDNTPLHFAAANSTSAIVAVLLVYGADADARNTDGRTPLELSREGDGATRALLRRGGRR